MCRLERISRLRLLVRIRVDLSNLDWRRFAILINGLLIIVLVITISVVDLIFVSVKRLCRALRLCRAAVNCSPWCT